MRIPKVFCLSFAALLVIGLLPLSAGGQPTAPSAAGIEPELLARLQAEGTANFFVKVAAEADLSAAYSMSWHDRGVYVWNALNEVAAATQAPAIAYAQKHGLDYASLLTTNSVFIRGGNLDAARDLAALPGVAYLRLEQILSIADPVGTVIDGLLTEGAAPEATTDWGITDTKADQAWLLGCRGQDIKVANIDTGVQWDHPALINQFACPGDPGNPACWADPSNICGGSACDNNGHGTHTMGTMVAKDDSGLPYIAGMAPDATWIACKGCETSSCSEFALTTCADWILAPDSHPDNRPDVVNNSWSEGFADPWYQSKVQAWVAAGIFPAFQAGNHGPSCGTLFSPGDFQESFASAAHDSMRNIASFSSRGPSAFGHDPYTKPNISAPGVSVCSSVPTNGWSCGYSGTDMASPHSAGAVAVVWSCCPDYRGLIDMTFEILQMNADGPLAGNCGAPPDGEGNYTFGYGYLNVLSAVNSCFAPEIGTLQGHVYDQDGNPIAGATVTAEPGGVTAITNADGFYTMQLMPGTYDVTASKDDYVPQTATVLVLEAQTTVQNFNLLGRGWAYGYVTDCGTGMPIAGATVTAEDGSSATTDPNGYYELWLDFGPHALTATAQDYDPESAEVIIVSGQGTRQDFCLSTLCTMHVASVSMKKRQQNPCCQFVWFSGVIHSEPHWRLEGVTVSIQCTAEDGTQKELTDVTNYFGRFRVAFRDGCGHDYHGPEWTCCVTNLVRPGYVYDPLLNHMHPDPPCVTDSTGGVCSP